jgi:hypothetical protein
LDKEIFIIVENIPTVIAGEYDTIEAICMHLGYFVDEKVVEAKCNELNAQHIYNLNAARVNITEDDETRFGFIPLQPQCEKT